MIVKCVVTVEKLRSEAFSAGLNIVKHVSIRVCVVVATKATAAHSP